MLIALIALGLYIYALGWKPDFQALGTSAWAGIKVISFASINDGWAMLKRLALAVAVILTIASFWTPLPSATNGGTYADLKTAIEQYQGTHGLTVDGVWGRNTNAYYLKGL